MGKSEWIYFERRFGHILFVTDEVWSVKYPGDVFVAQPHMHSEVVIR